MTSRCSVYGLGVETNLALAGLAGLDPPRQIELRMTLGSMPCGLPPAGDARWQEYHASSERDERGTPHMLVSRSADGAWFRVAYYDGTVVVVSARGDQVWATWGAGTTTEDTATYLLGPMLGLVLRLRGTTCLHASCVAIDGRAIAFAGPAGAGKSTLAAALAKRGHAVLTDDVCALHETAAGLRVQPAYPRVRLWPHSVRSLFGREDALPLLTPTWNKRFLDLRGTGYRFQREALPLAAVYLIGKYEAYDAPRIEPLNPGEALITLVSDTYATRLLDRSLRAREFEVLGRLVQEVPVKRVVANDALERIADLCAIVEEDTRALAAA
jgi:hypothetical protein